MRRYGLTVFYGMAKPVHLIAGGLRFLIEALQISKHGALGSGQLNCCLVGNPKRSWPRGKAVMPFFLERRKGLLHRIDRRGHELLVQYPLKPIGYNAHVENKCA